MTRARAQAIALTLRLIAIETDALRRIAASNLVRPEVGKMIEETASSLDAGSWDLERALCE